MINYLFLTINLFISMYFIYKKDYAILGYILIFQGIHLVPFYNLRSETLGYFYYTLIAVPFFLRVNGLKFSIRKMRYLMKNKITWSVILLTFMVALHTFLIGLKTEEGRELVNRYMFQLLPVIIYLIFILENANEEKFINQFVKGILLYGFLFSLILLLTTDAINIANIPRAKIRDTLGIGAIWISRIGATMFITSIILFFDDDFKKYINIVFITTITGIILIVIGNSRGPLISMLFTLIFYFIIRKKTALIIVIRNHFGKLVIISIIIIIIISIYNFSDLTIVKLYAKRLERIENYQSIGRYKRYELAYDYYLNRLNIASPVFLLGAGPGGFNYYFRTGFAHNFILEILFEYGFMGIIVLLLFISTNLKYSFILMKEKIPERFLVIPLLVVFRLTTTMFSGNLGSWYNLFFYSIILIYIYKYIMKRKKMILFFYLGRKNDLSHKEIINYDSSKIINF